MMQTLVEIHGLAGWVFDPVYGLNRCPLATTIRRAK